MEDERWPRIRLGDVVSIKHGWPFEGQHFSESARHRPIVVNIGNFRYSGGFRFEETTVRHYTGEYPREYILVPGDILLVMTCQTPGGEILGVPGRIPNDGRQYLHNQRLGKVVVTDPQRVDSDYLYWLFQTPSLNSFLATTASGTKILHTSPGRIESFEFELPPLPEQHAIAGILGALDDKIELNRRMNATLEALARALFTSWFVDFDPVRAKAEGRQPAGMDAATAALFPDVFEESAIGPIPRGWEVRPLDSVATFLNGLALQNYPPIDDKEWLPVIKIAELRRGNSVGSDRASTAIDPQYVVEDGDVLFSWSGSLEVVIWCGGQGALNQHLFTVTSSEFPKWLFYQWVCHHLPEFRAIAAGKATTMGHIQRHHLTSALVVVPPSYMIDIMSTVMQPLFDRFVNNNLESSTLAAIRDALLPKLLSGAVRVRCEDMDMGDILK